VLFRSSASLFAPAIGVANYMLIYQIFPEHAWWNKPLEPLAIRYSLTAALFLIVGMAFALPRLHKVRPALTFWDFCVLGMAMVVVTSELTGLGPTNVSGELIVKFLKVVFFVFCMTRIATTRRNFNVVIGALVAGSIYIGYDAWTAPPGAFARGRLDQIGGPDFRHSSGLAAHMAMMLPILGAAFMAYRPWVGRGVIAIGGALTINTIVLCRTRSAFVGLSCGAVAAILAAPRRRRLKTMLAFALVLAGGYRLADDAYWERMSTLESRQTLLEDPAASYRIEIWRDALEIVRDHPLGIGIGNFVPTLAEKNRELGRRAAHNSFILCWTELGMQGMFLFLTILAASIVQTWQCYRRADRTDDPTWTRYMAYGLFVSLVVSVGTQMFTERLYTEAFWWVLALPGCLKRVVIREAARSPAFGRSVKEGVSYDLGDWLNDNPLLPHDHARGALA